jgi:hypothetical protein
MATSTGTAIGVPPRRVDLGCAAANRHPGQDSVLTVLTGLAGRSGRIAESAASKEITGCT